MSRRELGFLLAGEYVTLAAIYVGRVLTRRAAANLPARDRLTHPR